MKDSKYMHFYCIYSTYRSSRRLYEHIKSRSFWAELGDIEIYRWIHLILSSNNIFTANKEDGG